MYETIKSIWYEKLQPSSKHIVDINKITALCKKQDALEEKNQITAWRKRTRAIWGVIDSYFSLIDYLEADAFIKGFRTGARTILKALEWFFVKF